MVQPRTPHILFVSQKVVDIKTPLDLHQLAQVIGDLREYLHRYAFIPGDKFTGELTIVKITEQGDVVCELAGSSLGSTPESHVQPAIRLTLPLGLVDFEGDREVQPVFAAVPRTSIDDGGNIQNMLLNTLVLTDALSVEHHQFDSTNLMMTTASTSDPFQRLNRATANRFRERVSIYPLPPLPDRFAILLPYEHSGDRGTLAITSEPKVTCSSLLALLDGNAQFAKAFRSATCLVSADPFFEILPNHALAPYVYVMNASTAFRAMVAVTAYGTNALLPMNDGEAGEVCKLMLSRARGTELTQTETPHFPPPLTIKGNTIDAEMLEILDSSIDKLSRYNPFFRHAEGISFASPISFGREGGLIIGMNQEAIACFTSIPSEEGERHLFDEYQFPMSDHVQETGAGDSVAAVVALFNTVSPEVIIAPYLEGREKTHRQLRHLASTVFVSCLSRIVGNLLIRTSRTNLTHIDTGTLGRLIEDAAKESVDLARRSVRRLPNPEFGIIEKWGIRVAMWVPRRVVIPTEIPVTIN